MTYRCEYCNVLYDPQKRVWLNDNHNPHINYAMGVCPSVICLVKSLKVTKSEKVSNLEVMVATR